jgi:hypothetical protein
MGEERAGGLITIHKKDEKNLPPFGKVFLIWTILTIHQAALLAAFAWFASL